MKKKLVKKRLLKKIFGSETKPRLSIFKSNKNIYVQAIDDYKQITITAASTLKTNKKLSQAVCYEVGEVLGENLQEKKITVGVFDRNKWKYHGRIAGVAEGVRAKGINI